MALVLLLALASAVPLPDASSSRVDPDPVKGKGKGKGGKGGKMGGAVIGAFGGKGGKGGKGTHEYVPPTPIDPAVAAHGKPVEVMEGLVGGFARGPQCELTKEGMECAWGSDKTPEECCEQYKEEKHRQNSCTKCIRGICRTVCAKGSKSSEEHLDFCNGCRAWAGREVMARTTTTEAPPVMPEWQKMLSQAKENPELAKQFVGELHQVSAQHDAAQVGVSPEQLAMMQQAQMQQYMQLQQFATAQAQLQQQGLDAGTVQAQLMQMTGMDAGQVAQIQQQVAQIQMQQMQQMQMAQQVNQQQQLQGAQNFAQDLNDRAQQFAGQASPDFQSPQGKGPAPGALRRTNVQLN